MSYEDILRFGLCANGSGDFIATLLVVSDNAEPSLLRLTSTSWLKICVARKPFAPVRRTFGMLVVPCNVQSRMESERSTTFIFADRRLLCS